MNECINIYELIQKELDSELSPDELRLLEEHCRFCFTCHKLREEFKQTVIGLTQLPLLDPSEDFILNVLTAIDKEHGQNNNFKLSAFTGLLAGFTLAFTSGIFLLTGLLVFLITGFTVLTLNTNLTNNLSKTAYYWLTYFYDLIQNIVNSFNFFFSPTALVLLLLISLISFIFLILLLSTRRTIL